MFDNIIGNDENKKSLTNIVENNNFLHSYIFSGEVGVGKFTLAKEFAKAILCSNTENKPCNRCKSCESFESSNNPDIIIIDEQEDVIRTEQIKSVAKSVLEKPILGNKKIYIVNNAENMTKEAQNSFLKTLEEPPEYVIIILITSNENLLLNTIKSRCIRIQFNKLSDNEIKEYFIKNSIELDEEMIKAFGGSIAKALKLKDKTEIYKDIKETFDNIEHLNELQMFGLKDKIFSDKEEIYYILDYINTILYDKILNDLGNTEKYEECISTIEKTKLSLKRNSNYDMTIDNLLFGLERSLKSNG